MKSPLYLGPFKGGTLCDASGMRKLLRVESPCGTLETLNLYVEPLWNRKLLETFHCGTSMWNLGEPGARLWAAAPNHPETLLEEPQAFQAVGEKVFLSTFL